MNCGLWTADCRLLIKRPVEILFCPFHFGIAKDFADVALLNHFAEVHKYDIIGYSFGLPEDMGYEDDGIIFF